MHIQFGQDWLGNWEHDCGNMTIHRYFSSLLNYPQIILNPKTIFIAGYLADLENLEWWLL